jgi:hypothetical protein
MIQQLGKGSPSADRHSVLAGKLFQPSEISHQLVISERGDVLDSPIQRQIQARMLEIQAREREIAELQLQLQNSRSLKASPSLQQA